MNEKPLLWLTVGLLIVGVCQAVWTYQTLQLLKAQSA